MKIQTKISGKENHGNHRKLFNAIQTKSRKLNPKFFAEKSWKCREIVTDNLEKIIKTQTKIFRQKNHEKVGKPLKRY